MGDREFNSKAYRYAHMARGFWNRLLEYGIRYCPCCAIDVTASSAHEDWCDISWIDHEVKMITDNPPLEDQFNIEMSKQAGTEHIITQFRQALADSQAEVERLRCCGNCRFYRTYYENHECMRNGGDTIKHGNGDFVRYSREPCPHWQPKEGGE
jgi:hypothetical protein